MADFRKALRVALAQRDMTQADLASKIEVTPQQISALMSTDANPRMETVAKIAEVLGLKISELLALGE